MAISSALGPSGWKSRRHGAHAAGIYECGGHLGAYAPVAADVGVFAWTQGQQSTGDAPLIIWIYTTAMEDAADFMAARRPWRELCKEG